MKNKNIYFIGFMGVGKTTIGAEFAKLINVEFKDIDEEIIRSKNMAISEIFEKYGEPIFREIESTTLMNCGNNSVISCGGGIVLSEKNRIFMKATGKTILLYSSAEAIFERIENDDTRPLLKNKMTLENIKQIMNNRETLYEDIADIKINTENKRIKEICEELKEKLSRKR